MTCIAVRRFVGLMFAGIRLCMDQSRAWSSSLAQLEASTIHQASIVNVEQCISCIVKRVVVLGISDCIQLLATWSYCTTSAFTEILARPNCIRCITKLPDIGL